MCLFRRITSVRTCDRPVLCVITSSDKHQFFTPTLCSHLRGHSLKLLKPRSTSSRQVRQNFFSQRVTDEWNKLPSDIVTSTSVNMFKNKLDDYWNDVGVKS